jgi:hypothetical protein
MKAKTRDSLTELCILVLAPLWWPILIVSQLREARRQKKAITPETCG